MATFHGGIYQITNTLTGDRYIGSASDLDRRKKRHWTDLRCGRHHCAHLQRAVAKYGIEAFEFTILERCSSDELIPREQHYLDTRKPEYNTATCAEAAMRGRTQTPESIAKRVAKTKGQKRSPEFCERMRQAHLGRKQTPEQIEARIAPLRGRKNGPLSEETRAKLSEIAKARPRRACSEETKAKIGAKARERAKLRREAP